MKLVKSKKAHFLRLESQRRKLVEYLLSDCSLIQGSYTELLVKCGKLGCHCENNPAHLVTRLGIRKNGTPRNPVVRVTDRERVKSLVENYKKHKHTLKKIKETHAQQEQLAKAIVADKNEDYE
jgi:hypothetical protein